MTSEYARIGDKAAQSVSAPENSTKIGRKPQERRVKSWHLILLSSVIHLGLLFYADHVDSHPERYGGLKYTDVDWRVVMDGARLIFAPHAGEVAEGLVANWAASKGWRIGDPYKRQTFRYTPLLPLLTSPSLIHPLLGKILLSIISLSIPPLLLLGPRDHSSPYSSAPFWPTHLIWTLNPFVLNITTRGSPEAIIVFLVVLTLTLLRLSIRPTAIVTRIGGSQKSVITSTKRTIGNPQRYEDAAAIAFALSISYKIYPSIYALAIWAILRCRHGLFGPGIWRFGIITCLVLVGVNGALWSIWGQPFLDHTFLYHFHRKDHRHNFSPYFYPIYLSLFSVPTTISSTALGAILRLFRNPLTSFIPQATLVLGSGWVLTPTAGLPFAMFVQTVIFVVFNKVCTSQYFMWFLALIPPIVPQLAISPRRAGILVGVWVLGQAVWLGMAYRLELLAQDAYLAVWVAGIGLFGISIWVLGESVDSCRPAVSALGFGRSDR